MEWLEFNGWSHEVSQRLAHQARWLHTCARHLPEGRSAESAEARARRLQTLLQHYPRTNPWGHPAAEC